MNILDAASSRVFLKKVSSTKGGEYAGPCPGFCSPDNGGTDRFRCWPAEKGGEGSYWCRRCNKGGDLVQFFVDFCGYSYRDAFAAAGRPQQAGYTAARHRHAGQGVVANTAAAGANNSAAGRSSFTPETKPGPVETWQIKAEEFVNNAHAALLKNEEMLHWLAGRGLDLQAVQGFRLGWFEGERGKNCMFRPRTSWGLLKITSEKTGKDKKLWLPRGLVIPCFKGGKIYRIRIRRPAEDRTQEFDLKYYVVPGSGTDVMGHNPDHQVFVVTEAELDEMLVARRAGSIVGSVALGAARNKPGAAVYYRLQKALRVLVALDYDAAGNGAWQWWQDHFRNAKQWPVPTGKDPGEAFARGVDIRQWVYEGLPPALTLAAATGPGYEIPAGLSHMQELQKLLQQYPARIIAEQDHARVEFDPGFKNRSIQQRFKELFFGDDEVHWYLRMYHPDAVIHGGNCYVQRAEQCG